MLQMKLEYSLYLLVYEQQNTIFKLINHETKLNYSFIQVLRLLKTYRCARKVSGSIQYVTYMLIMHMGTCCNSNVLNSVLVWKLTDSELN